MNKSQIMYDLEEFARQNIDADNHPDDDHVFTVYRCHSCNKQEFRITIEHHTGSKDWNFRGIIWGECVNCGYIGRLFTFTGEHRKLLREERPECECGNRTFIAGQCERFEGENGIPGFFDEGVVAGKCIECNRNMEFVYTD